MSKKIQIFAAVIFIISGIVFATIAEPNTRGNAALGPTPTPKKTVTPTVSPTPAPTAEPDEPPNPTPTISPTPTIPALRTT
jgi:hypothetical protein